MADRSHLRKEGDATQRFRRADANNDIALIRAFCRAMRPLVGESSRAVVAVSGGSDSIALLHLLVQSRMFAVDGREPALLVAHFDHGLRDASAQEAIFVQQSAAKLGLKTRAERWLQPETTGNLPAQARLARYEFLTRTAAEFGARSLITGHHQDDQVETFMERLIRGSGVTGLCAMAPSRLLIADSAFEINLIRPLLNFSRAQLQDWLQNQEIPWQEDPSNQNTDYRRANLRHLVLPRLAELEPKSAQRICATTQRLAQVEQALEWCLKQQWPHLQPEQQDGQLSISQSALVLLPDELLVRVLRRGHQTVTQSPHPPSQNAATAFIRLVRSARRRGEIRIRGAIIRREVLRLVFCESTEATH
ncbi:MAG: tRNA lysidine(34) synthetase TilS [Magnetococcales bacterium]|nr:tRNA lysidine(34) synthetase TilS [Magnetococcales bacterium]